MLQYLYLSRRAARLQLPEIDRIAQTSRGRNAELKITGVLLFDGLHFAQYLEGPAASVGPLVERIRMDPRHEDFRVLHHGPHHGEPIFIGWSLVYAVTDELQAGPDGLARLAMLDGPQAVDQFVAWTPDWCRGD